MMNLATDRPDVLLQDKFSGIDLILHSYRDTPDAGALYQDWKSDAFRIFITYAIDLSVYRAHNSIQLDVLPENAYYHKYKIYLPAVIAALQKDKPYTLSMLSEDLLAETVIQTWTFNNESVTVYLNNALDLLRYTIHINHEEGVTATEYAGNGNCIESSVEKNDGLWHKKFYYDNGHLKADYTETSQGIRVGMAYYYNEDGSFMAEHNFDTFPYSPIGYQQAKEIAAVARVVPHKTGLSLYWRVADESYLPALYIDAVSGVYELCAAPVREEKEVKTNKVYELKPFAAYITDLVGEDKLFMDDGETICEPADYLRILGILQELLHRVLMWRKWKC